MLPFLSAVNVPLLLAVVANVFLFDADGFLPPPFTHSYATDSVALQLTVSTEPEASPASLNLHTRLAPLSEAELAFLMKCGLPDAAVAPDAASAATVIDAANTTRTFFMWASLPGSVASPCSLRNRLPPRTGNHYRLTTHVVKRGRQSTTPSAARTMRCCSARCAAE